MRLSHILAVAAPMAAAATLPRQAPQAKVLIGAPNSILVADFDGLGFKIVGNATTEGTNPSWMAFREPNLLYAVDEFNASTNLFVFDPVTNSIQLVQSAEGSAGVVHLEFNFDKTRLVGSSFGAGTIDIWDITDGALTLLKQIVSDDPLGPNAARQEAPHPHQSVLDPTGRFFVVNDLGTDTVLVIDSDQDQFEVVNRVRVTPDGCGPRHGVFFPSRAAEPTQATHYFVLCEMLNLVEVFSVEYAGNSLQFVPTQVLSTFGDTSPAANLTTATAGGIVLSSDNLDVYVSNRNTGGEEDSISHFRVVPPAEEGGALSLEFSESISSGGQVPRMLSLSADGNLLFSTNQRDGLGVLALARNGGAVLGAGTGAAGAAAQAEVGGVQAAVLAAGTLVGSPVAELGVDVFGAVDFGPQFVMQV
ncbi:uncharacterized protein DNG_05783 [Cephalotrichum gorgonifer]|uniref:Uncharacterized protein n=1 Tax=Cephalotrichum gorgonifer TaxID=2041049 RepID=A0AAE8MYL4_9PEZI|nr:uncharacterized protein DNG_05783 [Cephalotrichum gorgonifer]